MSSAQQEEEVKNRTVDSRLIWRLLGYVKPYRWQVAFATVAALLQSVTQLAGPYFNEVVIDRYLKPKGQAPYHGALDPYLPADALHGVASIAAVYVSVLLIGFILDYAQTYAMQWVGQNAVYDLRKQVFAHVQRLSVAFFDRNPVGRLVTRMTNDVETLNATISNALVALFDDLFVLTLIVVVMIRFSWRLSLITIAVLPLIALTTAFFRRAVNSAYRRIRLAVARINVFLQEHMTGMGVVQAFNREEIAYEEFREINLQHCDAWRQNVFAYSVYYPVVGFLNGLAIACIIWFGGQRVLHNGLQLGIVVAFIQYAQRFFRPIQDLADRYNTLLSSLAGAERIFKLLDEPLTLTTPALPEPLPPQLGRIEFDHVWFAYKGEDWVLRDVSFTVEPGTTLAVVGHTGAGKTTIISLLLRFYDVQRGHILYNGVDIRELDLYEYRRRFGIVLQDPYLFSGTIAENIRLDDDSVPRHRVVAAERDANLEEFLASLPEGDATLLRERGAGLSTGQKQLVSFARALAVNPAVLILDEATASVDTSTELKIRGALDRMIAGRTSIVIAHRLSTIQRAHQIMVMHKGQLREKGTHQELLHLHGIYWRLYRLQYKDQEVPDATAQVPSGLPA